MLKEARLIVPQYNSAGKFAPPEVIDHIRAHLVLGFGGYTETLGRGGCSALDGSTVTEDVYIFDIATVSTDLASLNRLITLARYVLTELRQDSVYLRWPDGEVQFVTEQTLMY